MNQHRRGYRSYWIVPNAPMSLGCLGCPELSLCGGQKIVGQGFNCLDNCCRQPSTCSICCPNSFLFADRVREVRGFELPTFRSRAVQGPFLPAYVPLIFHGSARKQTLAAPAVAIPLYRFFNRLADCRFTSRQDVSSAFVIEPTAQLILSGVARDHEVESWWKLGLKGRIKAISNLRKIGVTTVTTPNFSVVADRPRWDDLHSIRRIAEVYHEFTSEGLHSILHVNGRTQQDFDRWTNFIIRHPILSHIAFEFTTGNKSPCRMIQHTKWLVELAKNIDRRLGLVLRGGTNVIMELSSHFDVTFIDSSPFEKAHHRFVAVVRNDGLRGWQPRTTNEDEPIDELLLENLRVSEGWYRNRLRRFDAAA